MRRTIGYRSAGTMLAGWLVLAGAAMAQPVDLTTLDRDMAGPRAQVLVLGSVHLSEMEEPPSQQMLGPLLDRLAAFGPDIITIEALSGMECDLYARHPSAYSMDFCASTDAARAATGLDVPSAIAGVNTALAEWPVEPPPAQRRQLAALFLAAGDRASALVQWLQLPADEQRQGDGLDTALVELLERAATASNESYQVAARLAARLGLQRVYAVDDHTGDNLQIADEQAFGAAIMQAWDAGRAKVGHVYARQDELKRGRDMLALYRYLNGPESQHAAAELNVAAAMRSPSTGHYPQIWVGGWEIRNLRMVANIRETFREHPGARVLSVVGVSHKPWFDGWLGQLQGVDIVDAQAVLD